MITLRRISPSRRAARRLVALVLLAAIGVSASGCAVSAYRRERLADPIVSFDAQARRDARLTKSLEAREGSTGGNGGAGGGCACN